jgi:hypothetical protein
LCFRCDDKFTPGHICTNKQFDVLIMEGEEKDTKPLQQNLESDTNSNYQCIVFADSHPR